MPLTIAEIYKFSSLATASYVRLGGYSPDAWQLMLPIEARLQERLPFELGQFLFDLNASNENPNPWKILDYYGGDIPGVNDRSGFAATLFEQNGEKVLAIRGTEPSEDLGVDLLSADMQIGIFGLALTQVVSMANYVMRLRAPAGAPVQQIKVEATVTPPTDKPYFDVAATGIPGGRIYLAFSSTTPANGLDQIAIGERVKLTGHSLGGSVAVMAAKLFPTVFDQNVTVFNSAGYDPITTDVIGVLLGPGADPLVRLSLVAELGPAAGLIAFHANQQSTNALAAIEQALFPGEEQPLLGNPQVASYRSESVAPGNDIDNVASTITGNNNLAPSITDITTEANSHVMEPFLDALSLHAFMYSMNQGLTIPDTNKVLEAASRDAKDTEETLLTELYKLLKVQDVTLPLSDASAGFFGGINIGKGDLPARSEYYAKLLELQKLVNGKQWTFTSLVPMQADELSTRAGAPNGLAYRYALKSLNPFAVLGPDSLYGSENAGHSAGGNLKLYVDALTTPAGMTERYIEDRAKMLAFLNAANIQDTKSLESPNVSGQVLYQDFVERTAVNTIKPKQTQLLVYSPGVQPDSTATNVRVVAFGTDSSDALQGRDNADRLFGGAGTDFLQGGKSNDTLEGGAGLDVYVFGGETGANDGDDEILDTDGRGLIRYTFTDNGLPGSTVIGGLAVMVQ
jgi:hypothetical protein